MDKEIGDAARSVHAGKEAVIQAERSQSGARKKAVLIVIIVSVVIILVAVGLSAYLCLGTQFCVNVQRLIKDA